MMSKFLLLIFVQNATIIDHWYWVVKSQLKYTTITFNFHPVVLTRAENMFTKTSFVQRDYETIVNFLYSKSY